MKINDLLIPACRVERQTILVRPGIVTMELIRVSEDVKAFRLSAGCTKTEYEMALGHISNLDSLRTMPLTKRQNVR